MFRPVSRESVCPMSRRANARRRTGLRPAHRVRLAAAALGLLATVGFAVASQVIGIPHGPEGSLLSPGLETRAQLAVLALAALASLLAVRWPGTGGSLLVVAGIGVGVLAAVEYAPMTAFVAAASFLVPALLAAWGWALPRHSLARAGAVGALALALAGGGLGAHALHAHAFGPTHPQSSTPALPRSALDWIWAGGTTPTGFTVVARTTADARAARLLVGRRADLSDARAVDAAPLADGRTARLAARGLRPGTEYRYAVEVDGALDRTRAGQLRTFPAGPASFTVAIGACARTGSNGAVFDAIRALRPLLYLTLGDIHYANLERNDVGAFRRALERGLRLPAPSALYRSTSTGYVWDDHDFGGNDADASSPTRPAAIEAYGSFVPHYALAGDSDRTGIAQAFTIGRVRVLLTDLRSLRSPASAPDGPGKSMLGAQQRRWLEGQLRAARGRWPLVLVASSVPWIGPAAQGADGWAGYAHERRAIARAIAGSGVKVVILGGDAHMVAIDDGTNSDYSRRPGPGPAVLHGAALDRRGGVKGGPYSAGTFPGSGQFGTVSVADDGGDRIGVTLRGRNWTGRVLASVRLDVPVGASS
jgi:hypothetical protein